MSLAIPPGTDLCLVALAANPNGDPPNFVDPVSQGQTVLGVGLTFGLLSTLAVAIRLATNARYAGKLRLDDYLCLTAHILMSAYLGLAMSFHKTFRHSYDIPLCYFDSSYVKKIFAENMLVGPSIWMSKVAILALYIRIFGSKRWLRYTTYAGAFILFLGYWSIIPLAGAYCTPRGSEGWTLPVSMRCGRLAIMGPVLGAIGTAADIFIIILPLPIVNELHMPSRKKIGLFLVFLVGFLALLVSAISLYFRVNIYTGEDKLWNKANVFAFAVAECYATIIVSCAPFMPAFWTKYFTKTTIYLKFQSSLFRSSRATAVDEYGLTQSANKPGSAASHENYYELRDAELANPHKNPYVSEKPYSKSAISKSTTINQRLDSF